MAIHGVRVVPLKYIGDERGAVMHFLRADSEVFTAFGEVYFSTILPGARKGLKLHTESIGHLAVPVGSVRFILQDLRDGSPTRGEIQEEVLRAPDAYQLLVVPPGVAYAWESIGEGTSLVANVSSILWRADESQTLPLVDLPFDWEKPPVVSLDPQVVEEREGTLVDVRTQEEFAEEHAASAINIPLDSLDVSMLPTGPVYMICLKGGRSSDAARRMVAAGKQNVYLVRGGTLAWKDAGLPME